MVKAKVAKKSSGSSRAKSKKASSLQDSSSLPTFLKSSDDEDDDQENAGSFLNLKSQAADSGRAGGGGGGGGGGKSLLSSSSSKRGVSSGGAISNQLAGLMGMVGDEDADEEYEQQMKLLLQQRNKKKLKQQQNMQEMAKRINQQIEVAMKDMHGDMLQLLTKNHKTVQKGLQQCSEEFKRIMEDGVELEHQYQEAQKLQQKKLKQIFEATLDKIGNEDSVLGSKEERLEQIKKVAMRTRDILSTLKSAYTGKSME
jgi:hypothetical protein